jgi:hypothetical protein
VNILPGRGVVAAVCCSRFATGGEHRVQRPPAEPAFQVCSPPFRQCPKHTARRQLHAWQPIMNPAERSRMRLKLRLAPRLRWHDAGAVRLSDSLEL